MRLDGLFLFLVKRRPLKKKIWKKTYVRRKRVTLNVYVYEQVASSIKNNKTNNIGTFVYNIYSDDAPNVNPDRFNEK